VKKTPVRNSNTTSALVERSGASANWAAVKQARAGHHRLQGRSPEGRRHQGAQQGTGAEGRRDDAEGLPLSLIVVSTDACRRSPGEAWGMVEDCPSADEAAEACHRAGA